MLSYKRSMSCSDTGLCLCVHLLLGGDSLFIDPEVVATGEGGWAERTESCALSGFLNIESKRPVGLCGSPRGDVGVDACDDGGAVSFQKKFVRSLILSLHHSMKMKKEETTTEKAVSVVVYPKRSPPQGDGQVVVVLLLLLRVDLFYQIKLPSLENLESCLSPMETISRNDQKNNNLYSLVGSHPAVVFLKNLATSATKAWCKDLSFLLKEKKGFLRPVIGSQQTHCVSTDKRKRFHFKKKVFFFFFNFQSFFKGFFMVASR